MAKKKGGTAAAATTTSAKPSGSKTKPANKAESKAVSKAEKKAKAAKKVARKADKKATKSKNEDDDDQDLEAILDKMRRDWEDAHKVTEELVEGPPTKRANATLVPCPSGNYLWCIGGEYFSEDKKAHFYNDVFRYSPEKDEWRKYVSPTCPGPRSAHAVAASPAGGGKLFLFGGEFSSLNQTTFHHYRDFWCFDITTHSWDRIDTKVMPSARSGHRMAMWKHFVVLFGGFYDPGRITQYLDDLWLFDTQEYEWKKAEFKPNERKPSPRSGFSFLSTPEGILLHGGYCMDYTKGKRSVGVMLEDTWFLKMSMPTEEDEKAFKTPTWPIMKWEKRKKTGYAPSIRSGCTMAQWVPKNTGILFGGVTDEDVNEETLESIFHNDLYGYQIAGNGRWISMPLRRPKKKGEKKKKKVKNAPEQQSKSKRAKKGGDDGSDSDKSQKSEKSTKSDMSEQESDEDEKPWVKAKLKAEAALPTPKPIPTNTEGDDPDDPNLTIPLPRYNAMLAVLRNTLYIYGGILEKGSREYTLDDFQSLSLDKLDRYVCLRPSTVEIPDDEKESSSEDDSGSDDSDGSGGGSDGSDPDEPIGVRAKDAEDEPLKPLKVKVEDEPLKPLKVKGEEPMKVEDDLLKLKAEKRPAATPRFEPPQKPPRRKDAEVKKKEKNPLEEAVKGVSKTIESLELESESATANAAQTAEDSSSTPLPGETLALFYQRTRTYWAQKVLEKNGGQAGNHKEVHRDGFQLCKERYTEYQPTLKDVEKILADAGLDKDEMRKTAKIAGTPGAAGPATQSRNRR